MADVARRGARVLGDSWHAAVSAGARVAHGVTRWAAHAYHAAVHMVHSAVHDVARAATATVRFVKHHAAAIAAIAVSVAVFAGCEAVLGAATAGVGAVAGAGACGALAGAAGNAAGYGVNAAQTGKFSWAGLAESAGAGAVEGAAGGVLGGAAAEGASAVSGLLARGAAAATADGAAAGASAGTEATAAAATSDTAATVAQDAGRAEEDLARSCAVNSFTRTTRVLLANGAKRAISRIRAGQKVLASDPYTGVSGARRVAKVIVHSGVHAMAAITLAGGVVIYATAHHPVWDVTAGTFTYAADLHPGDRLREPTGATAEIAGVRRYTAGLTAYNLDVTGIHTYYVQAGRTAILVHNSCGSTTGVTDASGYTWAAHSADTSVLEPGEAWEPGHGTPVIGRLPDTKAGEKLGFARVNMRKWSLEKNDAWVQTIIDQGGSPYVGSPTGGNYWNVARAEPSVFAREVQQFLSAGYHWAGDYLAP